MSQQTNKDKEDLNFPVIQEIKIDNFSLYKKADELTLLFDKEVFCLAGANGLGKSTFLTIINFGLTGVVFDPDKNKKFSSIVSTERYYNKIKKFAESYFDGRIEEDDRERASVTIRFQLADFEYEIERNFFNPEELEKFERRLNGNNTISNDFSENELFNSYNELLVQDSGLASFDQFVFLQLFVFTFDEHHNLLFWDQTLMETTLYIFFGLNMEDARRANNLRKQINRLGSNIRNFIYHKGRTKKELAELKANIEDLKEKAKVHSNELDEYENLLEQKEENYDSKQQLEHKIKLTELNIADLSIQLSDLKGKYQLTFDQFMSPPVDITTDKKINKLLKELGDNVCSSKKTEEIYKQLTSYIKENICKSVNSDEEELSKKLSRIDVHLKKLNKDIDTHQDRKERIKAELSELDKEQLALNRKIVQIEKEQSDLIKHFRASSSGDLTGLLDSYKKQIDKREKEINEKKAEKLKAEKDLKKLERELNRNFAIAEQEFMPIFQNYVANFLGLDVAIKLRNSSKGAGLVLEINNTERMNIYQLSESQRYFVDIGLRMALIQYGCQNAMLLIDTPEGSLDIAYESKAGKMFAEFAQTKFKLLLTANINTSQLLIQLAQHCKNEGMRLEKMTDWTFLSEVQEQEQSKIESAFETIQKSLEIS